MAVGGNIKGITIKFEGDTSNLGRAMKKINSDAKGVDKSLRDVNKALKFNPGNTELLAQKQTLLKQKVQQTKQQLDALKQAQATMDANGVDKNSQEYMELRREIIQTESKLKHFEQESRKLNNVKLTALGEQLQQVGDKMKKVGENMTKYVTGPIVALGAGSIAAFKVVDDGYDVMIAKTGATGEQLEEMKGIVDDLTSSIPTDFETAGAAVGEVNTRFGLTGDALDELSRKFIMFAQLNNTDVSSSIDSVQKALSAFGLGAEYAGPMLDRLNLTGQQTGVSMDSLTAGLIQNATAFQEMGLSMDQSIVLMGQMEKSGANQETVMQGLRKALKEATEEGKPLDQALSDLQDTILNGTDSMDGLTASYELFGRNGDQIYGAVKNGTLDFNNLAIAAEDAGGSVENTFAETLDPMDEFMMMLNDLKRLGAEVGSSLLSSLQPVLEKIAGFIQKAIEWWNQLSPGMQQAIIIIAGIAAVAGPLIGIIGGIISAIGNIIFMAPAIAGAIAMIQAPLLPIIAIILAIIAAVIAIIAIIRHWGEICEWFRALWERITARIQEVWDVVQQALITAWETLKQIALTVWEAIKQSIIVPIQTVWKTIQTIWNAIKSFFTKTWDTIKNTASTVWNTIKDNIITPIQNAWSKLTEIVESIKGKLSETWESIKSTASTVWEGIKSAITAPIETAKELVSTAVEKIKGLFPLSIGKIFSDLKLPHISVTAGSAPFGIGGKGSLPKFSVDWYAKGGIFDNPSIIGIGEAGAEAVVPLDKFWGKIDRIADAASGSNIQINVYAAEGMSVADLASEVERRLITMEKRRNQAWR